MCVCVLLAAHVQNGADGCETDAYGCTTDACGCLTDAQETQQASTATQRSKHAQLSKSQLPKHSQQSIASEEAQQAKHIKPSTGKQSTASKQCHLISNRVYDGQHVPCLVIGDTCIMLDIIILHESPVPIFVCCFVLVGGAHLTKITSSVGISYVRVGLQDIC